MLRYAARRLLFSIPTLLVISFIVFALLDLAPNDPTAQLPLTIPPETRQTIRESLGLGQPFHVRYFRWLAQFMVHEPAGILNPLQINPLPSATGRLSASLSVLKPK